MKKNVLFAALAAVALTSCSNEIENITPDASLKAIEFKPLVTRTGTTETNSIDGTEGFKVYGFEGASLDNTATKYMDGVSVTNASGNGWSYSGNYYWSASGSIYFFAHYPQAAYDAAPTVNTGSVTYDSYTVPGNVDLLLAANTTATPGSAVNLSFGHALSQIAFQARYATDNDGLVLNIQEIEVTANSVAAPTVSSGEISWSASTTSVPYTYDLDATTKSEISYAASTYTDLAAATGNLMLLPQSTTGVEIAIKYTITEGSSTGTVIVNNSVTAQTIDVPEISWEPGMKYTYQISITGGGKVSFGTIAVEGWEDGSTDAE